MKTHSDFKKFKVIAELKVKSLKMKILNVITRDCTRVCHLRQMRKDIEVSSSFRPIKFGRDYVRELQ